MHRAAPTRYFRPRQGRDSGMLAALAQRRMIEAKAAIVVAHPDDETIGAGGSMHPFPDLLLIMVTDGAPGAWTTRRGRDLRRRRPMLRQGAKSWKRRWRCPARRRGSRRWECRIRTRPT